MWRSRCCATSWWCCAARWPRPRHSAADRLVLATLAALLPRERWGIFLVTPSTLLRWHRELVRRWWTYPPTGRRDRRRLPEDVVELVVRLARENRRWGYLRIVGECRKLGVTVSATSVRSILRSRRLGPALDATRSSRATLGAGTRLFEHLGPVPVQLERPASLPPERDTPKVSGPQAAAVAGTDNAHRRVGDWADLLRGRQRLLWRPRRVRI
jgi:hypothetical protein